MSVPAAVHAQELQSGTHLRHPNKAAGQGQGISQTAINAYFHSAAALPM